MLNSLRECGDNYLPVFKFIHSLCCSGETFLSPEELTSLLQYCTREPSEAHAAKGMSVSVSIKQLCSRVDIL